ncbi:hypothetical protein IIC68_04075 [archaeon]|nr:hypothetical protein [archaeon]
MPPKRKKPNQKMLDKMTAASMNTSGITRWHDPRISFVGRQGVITKLGEHYDVSHLSPNYAGDPSRIRNQKKKRK